VVAIHFSSFVQYLGRGCYILCFITVSFLGWLHGVYEGFQADALANSPITLATETARRFTVSFDMGQPLSDNGFGMASRNFNSLNIPFYVIFGSRRIMLLLPGFYITFSRRLHHGHRMYVNPLPAAHESASLRVN
jgi:hypothetical protein